MVPARIEKLHRSVRERGLRESAGLLTARLWCHLLMRERLIVLVKPLNEIAVPLRRGRIQVERIERRHLEGLRALNRDRGEPSADVRFEADIAAGYGGFVGLHEGEVIACYWWVDRNMRPPHRDFAAFDLGIELGERDVYGCDLHIQETHRAGGTAPEFLYEVESRLRGRGFERIWGYVLETNRAARWNYSARGYQPIWTVVRTRVLHRWRSRIVKTQGGAQDG